MDSVEVYSFCGELSPFIWVSRGARVRLVYGRRRKNGGFEVHVRDMEENVLDAKTIIDPTVCSMSTGLVADNMLCENTVAYLSCLPTVSHTKVFTKRIDFTLLHDLHVFS